MYVLDRYCVFTRLNFAFMCIFRNRICNQYINRLNFKRRPQSYRSENEMKSEPLN